MFAARYPMAQDPGVPIRGPATETEMREPTGPLKPMDGKQDPHGSIQAIPQNQMQKVLGQAGRMIQGFADQLDKVGVKFKVPGTEAELNPTLKDITLGDLGKVLQDISYGFPPVTGKGTTLQLKPEALEILNALILAAPVAAVGKAIGKGGKTAATAAVGAVGALASSPAGGDAPQPASKTLSKIKANLPERSIKYDDKGHRAPGMQGARG
jgi:predicted RNA-binding protein YlqC (UPF0109 family)